MITNSVGISVIMATFNRADLFEEGILSLIKQDFTDYEFILVDDGSTDQTFQIFKKYLDNYPNFRYIRHSNRKQPGSLNVGLQNSSGKYITFLDSDDHYLKNHLRLRYNFMEKNPEVHIIHGGVKIIGSTLVPDKDNPKQLIDIEDCTVGGTIFARRSAIHQLKGFKPINYASDSDLVERALENELEVAKVDYPTYVYHRLSEDSITNSR
ncbi:MAG: glycosyltransferase family 2 protein [Cyclobacteriaceae bacterium]|nr:glycosyltransferase family 2 protein [Cyclobacteriaceae bacterium]MCH8514714.1 glycosyltransferase family 2 protein [Cyclobacteriaceae bacterium]